MKNFAVLLTAGFAVCGAAANSWFPGTKAVYNKWHQTELERWLSDHDIPYPQASDRKDLETLIEKNWDEFVVQPYRQWDTAQLSQYLQDRGKDVQNAAENSKDSLVSQVKANWYETEDAANQAWSSSKEWIFDTWSDSQLKSFCDKNGIPVPQPRHRDTVIQKTRQGFESVTKKLGESASYPGDWLYQSWSESDLKEWLDKYGVPAPQPTSRDKLIAMVRRNSRLAYLKSQAEAANLTASAQAAYATLTDMIIDAWGESQLKEFCDKNNIRVPQGTKQNELRALVRKHRAEILGDNIKAKGASAFGAATSSAGNQYAKATDSASLAAQHAFDETVNKWSESRMKSYLDARGVPVPQGSNLDSLRALVRKNSHKAASGWTAWTFDDFSRDTLKDYLVKNGDAAAKAAAKKKDAKRDDLLKAATSAYSSASKAGGSHYASATSYLSSASAAAESRAFDTWTSSDLKSYLDSYGVPVPQGSNVEELKALARKQSTYFKYGTSSPGETILAKLGSAASQGWRWAVDQLKLGGDEAQRKAAEAQAAGQQKAKEMREEL